MNTAFFYRKVKKAVCSEQIDTFAHTIISLPKRFRKLVWEMVEMIRMGP